VRNEYHARRGLAVRDEVDVIDLMRREGSVNCAAKSGERASFRFVGWKTRPISPRRNGCIFSGNDQPARLCTGEVPMGACRLQGSTLECRPIERTENQGALRDPPSTAVFWRRNPTDDYMARQAARSAGYLAYRPDRNQRSEISSIIAA